ncbi:translation elongation factor Ts [Spiroplasma endosymbiont of Polydrusus pterygomalis]|uniref:translation elongation factor Ts n=1 Tax=Spiroplasma endosymbiont of Polydrusus pterygomalis TaxID=3139327 RepID=UPI003CCA9572
MSEVKVDIKLLKKLRDTTDLPITDCREALQEKNNSFEEALSLLKIKGLAKAEKKSVNKATEGITKVLIDGNNAVIAELNCQTEQVADLAEFNNLFNKILVTILKHQPKTVAAALALKATTTNETLSNEIKLAIAKLGENIILTRFQCLSKSNDEVFGSYVHGGGKYTGLVIIKGDIDVKSDLPNNVAMQLVSTDAKYIDVAHIPITVREKELSIIREKTKEEERSKPKKRPDNILENIIKGRFEKVLSELIIVDQVYIKDNGIKIKEYLAKNHATIKAMIRYQLGEKIDNATK